MEGLNEIAATGAPGIVTALGMGTVVACLLLLYGVTHLMGSGLPRLIALRERRKATGALALPSENEVAEAGGAQHEAKAPADAIAGAITLALARHRSARGVPAPREATGEDAWKLAGRLRLLRSR